MNSMTDKEIIERAKEAEKRTSFGELVHSPISKGVNSAYGIGFIEGMVEYRNSLQEELVRENLEKAANEWDAKASFTPFYMTLNENGNPNGVRQDYTTHAKSFKAGAQWQKEQIKEALLLEVLPCFINGGEADEVVAKLDEVLNEK